MKSVDVWLVSFGLRCCALVSLLLFCFLYLIPQLFDLHADLANVGAAMVGLLALVIGFLWGVSLSRELTLLLRSDDNE